jgi:[pyruvate, water dikinase]-phosphate phosphotransferase / [pyruvate, water dikinase] kinase
MTYPIFFLSDGTGITSETLGRSLLTQFTKIEFNFTTIPYVNSQEKANAAVAKINAAFAETKLRPIIFATVVDIETSKILQASKGLVIDFFHTFLQPLESEFGYLSEQAIGLFHSAKNHDRYMLRIEAVNFAMIGDDGANTKQYSNADIVLIGASRSGKTPTSLYLALQFGMLVTNYPLTEEDFAHRQLPAPLRDHRQKLFGLIIDPAKLSQIRQERLPDSKYASLEQCQEEMRLTKLLFQQEKINYLDVTNRSIEELAVDILAATNLKRRL